MVKVKKVKYGFHCMKGDFNLNMGMLQLIWKETTLQINYHNNKSMSFIQSWKHNLKIKPYILYSFAAMEKSSATFYYSFTIMILICITPFHIQCR